MLIKKEYICNDESIYEKMKTTEQCIRQIERAIHKIANKFPHDEDSSIFTDIHLFVSQENGELFAYDDDNNEITRCVIEQWVDNKDEDFNDEVIRILRENLKQQSAVIDAMGIVKPFSIVLEDEDGDNLGELYLADDDTVIIGGNLMEDLDKDLDNFIDKLLEDL